MADRWFVDPATVRRLRGGPVGPHIDSFAALLEEQGYVQGRAQQQLRDVGKLSDWLGGCRIDVSALSEPCIEEFLRTHPRPEVRQRAGVALRSFLAHLRELGEVASPVEEVSGPIDQISQDYKRHLVQDRGLSQSTIEKYLATVRQFLGDCFGADGQIEFEQIEPSDISGFIRRGARAVSIGRVKAKVSALRSFLRFLRFRGEITRDLAAVVPTVAQWRLSTVPKWIGPEQVEQVLQSCDRNTLGGLRDHAVLLVLARLGLRAAEVVALELEDLDWHSGEITVPGKGGSRERLPLPCDVGEALAQYLRRGRPLCSSRRVFVRLRAPLRGFAGSQAIWSIVSEAVGRAGLDPPCRGAHLLRHSLATNMLRQGASLAEIGDVLRHRRPQTTEIYAKVDLEALRALARPWPGGGA